MPVVTPPPPQPFTRSLSCTHFVRQHFQGLWHRYAIYSLIHLASSNYTHTHKHTLTSIHTLLPHPTWNFFLSWAQQAAGCEPRGQVAIAGQWGEACSPGPVPSQRPEAGEAWRRGPEAGRKRGRGGRWWEDWARLTSVLLGETSGAPDQPLTATQGVGAVGNGMRHNEPPWDQAQLGAQVWKGHSWSTRPLPSQARTNTLRLSSLKADNGLGGWEGRGSRIMPSSHLYLQVSRARIVTLGPSDPKAWDGQTAYGNKQEWDFSSSPVVKTPHSQCRGPWSCPWSGK